MLAALCPGDPNQDAVRHHETSSCSAGEAEFPEVGMSLVSLVLPGSEATAGHGCCHSYVFCMFVLAVLIFSNSRGNFDILDDQSGSIVTGIHRMS